MIGYTELKFTNYKGYSPGKLLVNRCEPTNTCLLIWSRQNFRSDCTSIFENFTVSAILASQIQLSHNIDQTEHRHAKESKLSSQEIVDNVSSVFSRLHVLVVGPGLSRDSQMLESAKGIIEKAKQQDMAIVVDAVSHC